MLANRLEAESHYALLHEQVLELFATWNFAQGIFGHRPTLEAMNQTSRVGFGLAQRSMYADIVSSICAATDPAQQGKNQNLTIRRLVEETLPFATSEHAQSLRDGMHELEIAIEPLRRHRNKIIAHFDLNTLVARTLPSVQIAEIDESIRRLGALLSEISVVLRSGVGVGYCSTIPGNAIGEFRWIVADVVRFSMLRKLAADTTVSDKTLREMVANRSDQNDPPQYKALPAS